MKIWIKRYLPITLLFLLAIAAYASGYTRYLTWQNLKLHHMELLQWVEGHPYKAGAGFVAAYIFVGACSIPAGSFMIVLSGFLFTFPLNLIYADIGATFGGVIIFLAARSAFGNFIVSLSPAAFETIEKSIKGKSWVYLLFLRLVPIFPFWLMNIAPAFFNITWRTYVWTTAVGFLPIILILTQVGADLGIVLEKQEDLSFAVLVPKTVIMAFTLIGLGACLLFLYHQRKKNPNGTD